MYARGKQFHLDQQLTIMLHLTTLTAIEGNEWVTQRYFWNM